MYNRMIMKYLYTLLLLCVGLSASAQVMQESNANRADRRVVVKNGFLPPKACNPSGAPDLLNYSGNAGALVYDSCNNNIKWWNGSAWDSVSVTGGCGVDTIYRKAGQDSIFFTICGGVERSIKDSVGGGGGVTTMGAFGSSPNANGATISGTTLTLQPADATHPGGVSTTTQTFGGVKTFNSMVGIGSNPSGSTMRLFLQNNAATNSSDSILHVSVNGGASTLTTLLNYGSQSWRLYSTSTGAYLGLLSYGTPSSLPGISFFNSTNTGRTDIRYANNGIYFTSHSAGTNPEASNNLGVIIRGNSAATTQVGIGTASPNASAALHVTGTSKGVLIPSVTTAQRDAITPVTSLLLTNNTYSAVLQQKHIRGWFTVGQMKSNATLTGNTTMTWDSEWVQFIDASGGNVTVTLPTISQQVNVGWEFIFIRTDNSANTVTIQRASTQTINNALTSFTLAVGERADLIVATTTNWRGVKTTQF